MSKTATACIAILFFLALTGRAFGNGDHKENDISVKTVEDLKSLQVKLKAEIKSEIGEAKCSEDSQCKVLAIGANPCGGPESYQVYSEIDTDIDRLTSLAKRYKILRKTLHAKTGAMGACMVIPQPLAQCKSNRCIAVPKTGRVIF
jgi:hypothetical protein